MTIRTGHLYIRPVTGAAGRFGLSAPSTAPVLSPGEGPGVSG